MSTLSVPGLPPLLSPFEPYISQLTRYLTSPKTKRRVFSAALGLFLLYLIGVTSILAYGAFYLAYVPATAYSTPIYFDYSSLSATPGSPILPRAMVDLPGRAGRYLSYDHAYEVVVELRVPTSSHNLNLGNFMVRVDLRSEDDRILRSSSRPGILRYESPIVKTAKTVAWSAPLLAGLMEEEQILRIPIMESVHDSYDDPVHHAVVTLSTDRVWTYGATLHLTARLTGLRYLMYHWSIPTAFVFIIAFALWCILCAGVAWHVGSTWWQARAWRESEEALAFDGLNEDDEEDDDLDAGVEDLLRDDPHFDEGDKSHLIRLAEEEDGTSGESYGHVEGDVDADTEDAQVPETILAELRPDERLRQRQTTSHGPQE